MKFNAATAAALTALVASVEAAKDSRTFAVLRFTNKQLTKARADPIVSPGETSMHVHNVMGGSNFGLGSTGEDLMKSECSNALIKGDNSNYWFPSLYFHDKANNSFESVDIFYVNAYYFFEPTNDDIKAFPVGMSMVSGDAMTRVVPESGASSNLDASKGDINAVKWTCPRSDSNFDPPNWPADSDGSMAGIECENNKGEGVGFPFMKCDGYASPLRADIHFPSCYNPDAGLTSFKSNMAWPSDNNGKQDCPEGYIHVPHLFLEVYWNTPEFSDRWDDNSGEQPFVMSQGDVTGYSSHGDFMSGWDEELLQHIIDTCDAGSSGMDKCPGLFYGLNEGECTIPSPVDEQVDGVMSALPGSQVLQGWSYGTDEMGSGHDMGGHDGGSAGSATSASSSASATKTTKTQDSDAGSEPTATAIIDDDNNAENPATSTTIKETTTAAGDVSKPTSSDCSVKVKTVWSTVTVTAQPTAQPTDNTLPSSNSTSSVAGFKYAGCFKDGQERTLKGAIRPNLGKVDNTKCITHCQEAGFALAGTEYGGQCYCGDELVGSSELDESECNTPCEGDETQTCGGGWALSVFSKDGEASLKSGVSKRHVHDHLVNHRIPSRHRH